MWWQMIPKNDTANIEYLFKRVWEFIKWDLYPIYLLWTEND